MEKQNRTIKELLQVMLDNKQLFSRGLCEWNNKLWEQSFITINEYYLLNQYIKDNKPSINEWSISMLLYSPGKFSIFYWKCGALYPRVQWLKKHIRKNK